MFCRQRNDIVLWLKFFLNGVIETSEVSKQTLEKIIDLQTDVDKNRMTKISRARMEVAQKLMNHLYGNPIVEISGLSETLNITFNTTKSIVQEFVKCEILHEVTGKKRNKVFIFKDYLSLFEKSQDEN
jgi:Fic family protein